MYNNSTPDLKVPCYLLLDTSTFHYITMIDNSSSMLLQIIATSSIIVTCVVNLYSLVCDRHDGRRRHHLHRRCHHLHRRRNRLLLSISIIFKSMQHMGFEVLKL